jgi:hypothetical protein
MYDVKLTMMNIGTSNVVANPKQRWTLCSNRLHFKKKKVVAVNNLHLARDCLGVSSQDDL